MLLFATLTQVRRSATTWQTDFHRTDHTHLLFNNAGIGGGGSFVNDTREDWDRCFNICWHGVYYCARVHADVGSRNR